MGQKIVLSDTVFTDDTLPVLEDDPILSAGSLFLFDPGHTLGAFTGVPEIAALIPNIAWKKAAALLGSGTAASLSAVVNINDAESGKLILERTAKDGLHGIITQSAQTANRLGYVIYVPEALRVYMLANYARGFYVSLWSKITRKPISDNPSPQSPFHHALNSADYGFHMSGSIPFPVATRHIEPTDNDVIIADNTLRYASMSVAAVTGGGPSGNTPQLGLGSFGAWGATTTKNKQASRILYRAYIEDLTSSGRTYAAVDAIDYALWVEAFSAGGKFYGDTYTAASTLT